MEERKYCVYKHTSPSGKVYIGITHKSPNARWQNGKGYKKHPHFYNAIFKYGWENIQHEILCDGLSKSEAEQQEKHFIDLYQATNRDFGYNMTLGGECGAKFTDEVKEKISQSLKEYYKNTPGVLAKCSERQRGRHHSDETRRKMSESHRAMMTDERRAMISASQFGRKYPDRVGHPQLEESRAKISEAKRGKHYGGRGKKPKSVLCVDTGVIYESAVKASAETGVGFGNIYRVCNGDRGSAGGYKWRYAVEDNNDREVV